MDLQQHTTALPAPAARATRLRTRAAAALLALAGLGAAAVAQPAPPAESGPPPMHGAWDGGHRHGHGGPMQGRFLERMLDDVKASDEQRTRIRAIVQAAAADMRAQADTRRQLHEQGLTLLAQPTIDANAVEALRQQMLAQHDQASRRWSQAMVEAANVLTPQQRAQLAQQMRERAQRHAPGSRR